MNTMAATISRPLRPSRAGALGRWSVAAASLAVLGVGFVDAFDSANVSFGLALAGGVALTGFLTLTVRRYETAVAVGLLLMGIVRFQPAPPDMAFAVIIAVAAITGRFRLSRVPVGIRWLIGLFLIVNLLSLMDVVSMSSALLFLFITAYLAIFSLWLTGFVDSPARARIVVVTWVAIGVISAVVSVLALNAPIPGRSFILGSVDGGERASGLFKDPNVFGPFLVPIAVILLESRVMPSARRLLRMRPATVWASLLALTLGVLFCYSRAAWANYVIAIVIMLVACSLRRAGARRAMRALAGLLMTAAVVLLFLSASGSLHFLEHRAQLQNYDSQRFAAQNLGWNIGWTHPVGIGPGQFESYSTVAAQSTFVRAWAEQGPIGLLLWVAIQLVTLVLALRNVVRGRDTFGIGSAALLGAWCGLIFNSVVVDTLHWRHMWVVAALIWASAAKDSSVGQSARAAFARLREPERLALRPSGARP